MKRPSITLQARVISRSPHGEQSGLVTPQNLQVLTRQPLRCPGAHIRGVLRLGNISEKLAVSRLAFQS